MTSKQVVDRGRSAKRVTSTGETHRNEIANGLTVKLRPLLQPGEALPDTAFFVTLATRLLASTQAQLDAADRAHEAELSDDPAVRSERDVAAGVVRETVINLRAAVSAVGGAAALQALSVPTAPPPDTLGLERYAAGLHAALVDPTRVVINTSRAGLTLNRAAMAATLEPELTRLQAALQQVATEAAELGLTQTAKDKAFVAHDAAFSGVANLLEGLLTLAGREDLAARVRPSRRRPGTVEADDDIEV